MADIEKTFSCRMRSLASVEQEIFHKLSVKKAVESDFKNVFLTARSIEKDILCRFAQGFAEKSFVNSFSSCAYVDLDISHRHRHLTEPGALVFTGGAQTQPVQSGNFKAVAANVRICNNSVWRAVPVESVTISRRKSAPLRWSFTLFDPDGSFDSDNSGSIWHGWFSPDSSMSNSQQKHVEITITTEAGSRTYSYLIIKEDVYEESPEGGRFLRVSGTDYSEALFRPNQTYRTFSSKADPNLTAYRIISTILSFYNLSPDLRFRNFPVQQMDFQQEAPIDRIQTLLNEAGAHWRVEGTRFTAWIPRKKETADWNYRDCRVLYQTRREKQSMRLYNEVKVCRISKNAFLASRQQGDTLGRFSASFRCPFKALNFRIIRSIGVKICEVDYFNDVQWVGSYNKQFKSSNLPVYSGSGVTSVYFTVAPVEGTTSDYYSWEIEFTGIPLENYDPRIEYDASCTLRDESSIATYGLLPAPVIASNFTASESMATLKAEAFLREQGRTRTSIEFQSLINPHLEIDDSIFIDKRVTSYSGYHTPEAITTNIRGFEGEDIIEVVTYQS